MDGPDLSGELIVLSGAAGGIGRHVCNRLAALGASVVAVDVVSWPAEDATGAAGKIWQVPADVSVVEEVERLLDAVEHRHGRPPSTVCCHAGMVESHPILDYPPDHVDELFRVNVRTAFVLAQRAAVRWRQRGTGGHLVFTGSWVQDYPWPDIAPYCASKAALHALMRSFARELAPFGIRANAVLPGIVSVGMARRQWDEDEAYRLRAQRAIALGELQDPATVADAFAFLCSPLATYMTGSSLRVDGGCSLVGSP